MSVVTLPSAELPAKGRSQEITAEAPKKGLFARVIDAIIAARTAEAERAFLHYMQSTGFDPRK